MFSTLLVRAPAASTQALLAHAARRLRGAGHIALSVRQAHARLGAPMWQEVASRLSIARVDCDPVHAAEQLTAALTTRRAVIVAPLPPLGTWDRAVAAELSRSRALEGNATLTVFVTGAGDSAIDIVAERFDVAGELDHAERRRWWSAIAEDGHANVTNDELAGLETWWSATKRASSDTSAPELPLEGHALFDALSVAARAWPDAELAALVCSPGNAAAVAYAGLSALLAVGAIQLERGWVAIDPAWDARSALRRTETSAATCLGVAAALVARFPDDAWAHMRAAELLLRAEAADAADAAYATAIAHMDDTLARREIVARWMDAIDAVPSHVQLTLRMRAAERALSVGEADEAHRWAKAASTLATDDAAVTLLLGRAAVALGDLVSAKVALERGRLHADAEIAALIDVELAEVEYQTGNMDASRREATAALSTSTKIATLLRARNTLGKVLLAEAKWDEADRHFAEDAQTASAHGEPTAELRARLNRGIALLSKGLVDEARSIFEAVLADGERAGDGRACAFALDNLAVVATWRHEYASALALSERTLKLRQRLGDRLKTAHILANVARLRRKLGLIDHAEHAVAFGRRTLGPGMPAGRSTEFAIVAARVALERGNTVDARREIAKAIADAMASQYKKCLAEAHRLAVRIALEDGNVESAGESLAVATELASTDEGRAEVALLAAVRARACGEPCVERCLPLANEALALARVCGEEELLGEAHVLLAELYRTVGDMVSARGHLEQAVALRDQVATALPVDVRTAFLLRRTNADLARLQTLMAAQAAAAPSTPAIEEEESPRTQRSLRPTVALIPREMVGDDPAIRGLLAAVRKVARSNSTVLVRGESGTGKELVAEALHRASDRAAGPLVTVNCAALVETLLLSELFGHEKGAFTGAFTRRRGRFEMAEGGTLFLDEIGDISPRTQVALLRVLQERTFERVGGTVAIRANVRIICATHRDLRAMVERGEFREDLYYRLRGITLEVPALRARMGDLPRISEHLLARIALERGEPSKSLSLDALELLARHRWAGNVRELENALRAASLFADTTLITAADLVDNVDDLRAVAASSSSSAGSAGLSASINLRSSILPPAMSDNDAIAEGDEAIDPDAPLPSGESGATAIAYLQVRQGAVSLSDMKRQIERDCIARALAETKGNITRAANLLGMKRPRLSQLVKQYGLAAVSSEAP